MTFDYGMKGDNPIDNVRFYTKKNPSIASPMKKNLVSWMLPETFRERFARLYCKTADPAVITEARRLVYYTGTQSSTVGQVC